MFVVAIAERGADKCGERNDHVSLGDDRPHHIPVSDVAANEIEMSVMADRGQTILPEHEAVYDGYVIPALEEHRDQRRSDVTGTTGDEYTLQRSTPSSALRPAQEQ